jgi:metallophosphoesterase (TIGR00282 family)
MEGVSALAEEKTISVLCIGDVCGSAGVSIVEQRLRPLKRAKNVDFTIVNGENAALFGINPDQAEALFSAGVDVITLGNHAFVRRENASFLDENSYILRPANLSSSLPGQGAKIFSIDKGGRVFRLGVAVLLGRVHMDLMAENPFTCADRLLARWEGQTDGVIFEIHAEATSEKTAFAWHLSGRASAVFGTHTHVQTNDARLIGSTGYITDAGMTGPIDSVIGVKPETSVEGFLTDGVNRRYQTASGDGPLCGVLFTLNNNGRCLSAETVCQW